MQNTIKRFGRLLRLNISERKQCYCKLWEPEYLESMKSKIPLYDTLNIQLKGYDYPILESYQKYAHNLFRNSNISVEDGWALPPQHTQIIRYKPKSTVVEAEFKLKLYERNLQITDVSSNQLPILLRLLQATLPEGVQMNVHAHDDWYEDCRYVPDKELISLKTQLDEIATAKKK